MQSRAAVCERLGRTRLDRRPPLSRGVAPRADPFVYLQGANMSFRRDALVAVGGFDEAIAYVFDDVEVCATLIDAGHRVVALDGAPVHHHQAPSAVRDPAGELRDPFPVVHGRAYFAMRKRGERPVEEVLALLGEDVEGLRFAIRSAHSEGTIDSARRDALLARVERGSPRQAPKRSPGRRRAPPCRRRRPMHSAPTWSRWRLARGGGSA